MTNSKNHPEGSDPTEEAPRKEPQREPTAGDLQAQALTFHERGANLVALQPPEGDNKGTPLHNWTPWKEKEQSKQFIRSRAWKDAAGLSAISGPGGWRCLDFDDAATDAAVRKALDALDLPEDYRWVVRSGSGQGFHIWFRCEQGLPTAALGEDGASEKQVRYDWPGKDGLAVDHVELRWWGVQTILPPSLHESGRRYRWRGERPEGPPAKVSAGHVVTAFFAVAEKPEKSEDAAAGNAARRSEGPRGRHRQSRSPGPGSPGGPGGLDKEELERRLAPSDRQRCFRALGFQADRWKADGEGYVTDVLGPKELGEGETPNFSLNLETGSVNDFGSGDYTGDLYGAVQDVQHCSFPEALAWIAERAGVDVPERSARAASSTQSKRGGGGGDFTLEDFREALGDLQGGEAEDKAHALSERCVTGMDRTEVNAAARLLMKRDVTKREARQWRRGITQVQKERRDAAAAAAEENTAGGDLSGGELTAWIAGQIEETDAFATDRSGALFYYEAGCYHPGGETHLFTRVREVLQEAGMTGKFSEYRCREVLAWFEAGRLPELWDRPPENRICLKNGVLNLETLQLEEHGPEKWLSTVKIPIRYDPEADGTAWEEHFADVLPEQTHRAGVGFELFAKLLTPATEKGKAVLFHGPSDTGKSLTLDMLVKALGAEGSVTSCSLQELENNRFARGDLAGKVANVNADLPAAPLEGTSVFKSITGGRDRIRGARKHQDAFNFRPHCHMLFSSNHGLRVKARDNREWFWERWLVLPFRNTFEQGSKAFESGREIEDRLQEEGELSALLNRALELLPQVQKHGVTVTEEMRVALDRMKRPGGDGHASEEKRPAGGDASPPAGDGHRAPVPAPDANPAPQVSDNPGQKSYGKAENPAHGGMCRNVQRAQRSWSGPETPQTGKGDETPRRGDGSSSNTSTAAASGDGHTSSGDGHGAPPPEEEVEVLYEISGDTITEACGFGSGGPNELSPEENEDAPGERDSDGGRDSDSSGQPPPPGA